MKPTLFRTAAFNRIAALAAGVLLASALSASALTITPGPMPTADQPNPIADATTGTVFENVSGSVNNVRRSPWEGTALANTGLYTSVSANASATYEFDRTVRAISFLWGSPDSYNDLEIILGGSVVETVIGTQLSPPYGSGAQYVTLSGVGLFDSVTFKSGQNAFEFANLETSQVPVPAAVFLLGGALAGLGALRRRS